MPAAPPHAPALPAPSQDRAGHVLAGAGRTSAPGQAARP